MRLPPRRRRVILTLLCIPAVVTAALWCTSFYWLFLWAPPSSPVGQQALHCASLQCGSLHYTARETEFAWRSAHQNIRMKPIMGYAPSGNVAWPGIEAHYYPVPFSSVQWDTYYRPGNLRFPLLPLALALLIPPLTFWLLTRPLKPGHCTKCNYNRAGLPLAAKCPECGATAQSPTNAP